MAGTLDNSKIVQVLLVDSTGTPSGGGGGGGGAVTSVDLGVKADASATTDTGTFSLISLTKRALEKFTVMVASLGGVADAAWTSGSGSIVALLKTIATKALDTAAVLTTRAPYTVARPITPNTNVTAGQAVLIACTVAGNQVLELSSGNTISVPVVVGSSIIDNIAVIDAPSSGTTATATVTVLAVS